MNTILENIKDWFNSLSEQPQIDERILNSFSNFISWLAQLSLNQKLVLLAALIIWLFIVYLVFKLLFLLVLKVQKWSRRKRIPNNKNLHLDRDQHELKYGSELRKNMRDMKSEAPFKKDTFT